MSDHMISEEEARAVAVVPAAATGPVGRRDAAKVELQEFNAGHLEQVLSLYAAVFGVPAARDFQARWRWSQEANLDPRQSMKWVLVADNRVAGFLATVPQPYWLNGELLIAHTPSDYMVHPSLRFHGLQLMRACFQACPNIVTCDDMPATIQVTRWLGASSVAPLVRFAKVLDPRGIRTSQRWARIPRPLAWTVAQALDIGDRARRPRAAGVRVVPVDEFDRRFDTFAQRLARYVPLMPARDRRFLQWRYGPDSPHAAREIGVIPDGAGGISGYVIVHRSQGPARAGRILDLQYLPDAPEAAQMALLGYGLKRLRRAGAWVAHYHHLDTPHALPGSLLRLAGFKPRGRHQLLVRFAHQDQANLAARPYNWNLSYGDAEASHAQV